MSNLPKIIGEFERGVVKELENWIACKIGVPARFPAMGGAAPEDGEEERGAREREKNK